MRKRLVQILGFLSSSLGWTFVLCTMAMDYWRISQLGGQGGSFIIKVAWYWSNLWKDCFTDSTAVTNCRDFGVLWAVTPFVQGVRGLLMCGLTLGFFAVVLCFLGMECTYIGGAEETKDKMVLAGAVFHLAGGDIHMCRALIIIAIILSFFGSILVLVGMKCTKIGGSEIANARVTFAGGMNYLIGGMCSMVAFSYYGNKIRAEFQDPHYKAQKFEIGVGVFIGWGGSTLLLVGGLIYSIFAGREGCHSSSKRYPDYRFPDAYTVVPTNKSVVSLARTEITESRKSRNTSESGDSSFSRISSITETTASNAYV
ncbi:uncharacterized protein AKAME5_001764500 [Lates japonicus]|uniref:Claudin n=1 Tax=Lates japonicus TaxID=270547 RepID=A0AAD3N5A0_LATJO|nr:uncharacterized protein AKAME5_001764500 [Lates japonicus]